MSQNFQERFRDRVGAVGKQGELDVLRSLPVQKAEPSSTSQLPSTHFSHASLPPVAQDRYAEAQFARPIRVWQQRDGPQQVRAIPFFSNASSTTSLHGEKQPRDRKIPLAAVEEDKEEMLLRKAIARPQKPLLLNPVAGGTKLNKKSLSADKIPAPASLQPSPTALSVQPTPKPSFAPYTLKDYRRIRQHKYVELGGLGPTVGSGDWLRRKEMTEKRKSYAKEVLLANATRIVTRPLEEASQEDDRFGSSRQRALEFSKRVKPPPAKFEKLTIFLGTTEDEEDRIMRHTHLL